VQFGKGFPILGAVSVFLRRDDVLEVGWDTESFSFDQVLSPD